MKDDRGKIEKFFDWLVRWMAVVMLVTATPLWFVSSKTHLNENDAWTFIERFRAASLPFVLFFAGWLWCRQWDRRKAKKWVDRAVKNNPVWRGEKQV